MLNQVNLIGRLACNPELKVFSSGIKKATLVVAVEREYKSKDGEQKADFIYVEVWRKLAEQCADNLEKGRLIAVEGRIQIDSWEDRDSGEMRYKTGIVAKNVTFLDKSKAKKQATA